MATTKNPSPRFHVVDPYANKYAKDSRGKPRTATREYFEANPDKFDNLILGSVVDEDAGGGTAHESDEVSAQTADGGDKEETD